MESHKSVADASVQNVVHTPGPWRVGNCRSVVADSPMGTHSEQDNVAYYGGALVAESIRTEANARLIAAAPDLLGSLIDFIETVRLVDPGVYEDSIAQANAVIEKATGKVA